MLSESDIDAAHPDAFDFVFGNLPKAKRAGFNRHLIGCRYCQAVVEEYSDIGQIIQSLPPHVAPPAGLEDRTIAAMVAALADQRAQADRRTEDEDQDATRVYPVPQLKPLVEPETQLQPPAPGQASPAGGQARAMVTGLPVWRRHPRRPGHSANTHIVILPARFDAAGAAGRIVPEADGRVVCSLRSWPSPITTGTAIRYVRGMRSGGRSDPAAGAGELDCFVAVGGAELGGCGGEVVADCAGGQGRASGDFVDGGAACREFQDVGFAGGERAVAGADGVGGEFGVDVAAAAVDGADHVGQDLG